MGTTLAEILKRATAWPSEAREELVSAAEAIEARHGVVYQLSAEERAAIERGRAEFRNGNVASDERVAAVFNRQR